jgi:nucleoid DNA-binding protein
MGLMSVADDLQKARTKLIEKRRAMAAEMAKVPSVSPATARDFTAIQEAIKSIDEALAEEEHVEVTGFVPQ